MTDSAKAMVSSISGAFGGEVIEKRWYELFKPEKKAEDPDDIIDRIKGKLE